MNQKVKFKICGHTGKPKDDIGVGFTGTYMQVSVGFDGLSIRRNQRTGNLC